MLPDPKMWAFRVDPRDDIDGVIHLGQLFSHSRHRIPKVLTGLTTSLPLSPVTSLLPMLHIEGCYKDFCFETRPSGNSWEPLLYIFKTNQVLSLAFRSLGH